jgi:hypothetical protein
MRLLRRLGSVLRWMFNSSKAEADLVFLYVPAAADAGVRRRHPRRTRQVHPRPLSVYATRVTILSRARRGAESRFKRRQARVLVVVVTLACVGYAPRRDPTQLTAAKRPAIPGSGSDAASASTA